MHFVFTANLCHPAFVIKKHLLYELGGPEFCRKKKRHWNRIAPNFTSVDYFFLQLRSCDIYRKSVSDLRDIVESVDNDKTEGDQEDNPKPCQV